MYNKNTQLCVYLINNNYNNYTFNTTKEFAEDVDNLVIGIPYGILLIFVLTSNFMLIYGFYKTSRPFTIITKLFIYLSLVDIAYISFVTLSTTLSFLDSVIPCWFIYLISVIIQFMYFQGLSTFATISLLRYQSIKKPLNSINEASHVIFVLIVQVFVCGFLGVSLTVLFFFVINPEDSVKVNYILPASQFLAVAFVLSVNILSYIKLKSMKKMSGFSENDENTSNQRQKTLSEANTSLLYITTFYILCPIPAFIVNLLDLNILLKSKWGIYLFRLTYIVYMTNGGINSLIVILRTQILREFYVRKFCFPRKNESPENRNTTELSTI